MRDQLSRKTKVPYGMIALVGRLVVLSVCMLVFGVTSTRAQTGQDARCANFSGQAKGLCTAAVAAGCFEGVQSPDCDALTANWNEHCHVCVGTPPWEAAPVCPCAATGSALELNALFLTQEFAQAPVTNICRDDEVFTDVLRQDCGQVFCADPILQVFVRADRGICRYVVTDASVTVIAGAAFESLTPA